MSNILVGISTYNEIENLPDLIQQIDEHLPSAHILIVDDNSPDGTGAWSEQQSRQRDDFFCVRRAGKLGLGTATIATMTFAIENEYELLINMDADFSHPPARLPELVAAAQDADIAVASRYVRGGKILGWPLYRRVMSRCVNGFARLALGLPTSDCSGSYRCYRVSKLKEISFDRIRSKGYSFFEEILWHLRHAKARFVEVPFTFQDREKGKSKINYREAINALRIIGILAFQSP